jgi:LysM repeat protein
MQPKVKLAGRFVAIVGLLALLLALGFGTASAQGSTHVVKAGETLATIAQAYGTSVKAIVNANGLASPDLVRVGQRLVIPAQGTSQSNATTAATGSTRVYTVKPGDTLGSIARSLGVSANAIVKANGITNPNLLYVGQRLTIPGAASGGSPDPAPAPRPSGNTVYVVKAGDTLGKIAQIYGTTAGAIAGANGLTSPNLIRVGMRLVIPGSAGGASDSAVAPSGKASRLVVSISAQHCWLYQGNAVIGSWTCSTGRRASPTRTGTFRVQSKLSRAYGSTWNIIMPYWLGIYWAGSTENGIHGLPWNAKTGARTWDGLVGTRITYGCVMLNDAAAKKVWNMAYIGMPVIIKR